MPKQNREEAWLVDQGIFNLKIDTYGAVFLLGCFF